ncbi:MAG: hypothetical protein IIB75_06315 [Proteobacteria bacterium]|nr:hypothetical protein [Pseudomonadota bacterium]
MPDKDTDPQDRGIQALLKDYPMPAVAATYFDHALVQATHEGSRRQRNRWMITGFGSAVAAGLALWMIGGFFLTSPDLPTADAAIPGITMTLAKPQTVNLIFATVEALPSATLTVRLPEGIELVGFPGLREISWETSLSVGKNLLPLTLIATSPFGGEVYATLEHDNRGRTFRLRVEVS